MNVMEGSGGGLGSLVMHCVGCSHLLLLHCMCLGGERGVSFQGWKWLVEVDCKLLRGELADCKLLREELVDCKLLGVEDERVY